MWPPIAFLLALWLLPMAALTILQLQRAPWLLFWEMGALLLVALILTMVNGGHSPLERVNLCPQGTNLAGCPNYVAPVIDPAHDIPETTVPDYRPAPTWANNP